MKPKLSTVLKIFFQLKWKESKIVFQILLILASSSLLPYWIGVGTFYLEAKIRYDVFPVQSRAYQYNDHNIYPKFAWEHFLEMEYNRTFPDGYSRYKTDVSIPNIQPIGYWWLGVCNLCKIVVGLLMIFPIFLLILFVLWIRENWRRAVKIAERIKK